jgi:hypothetical protein
LRLAKKRANHLEKKLKVSKKAHKKSENDAAGVEDLRQRLRAAEDALSDKEATLVQWEADIIACFETQAARFSSNSTFPLYVFLACMSMPTLCLY